MILDSLFLWAFAPSKGNPSIKWLVIHFIIRTIVYALLLSGCLFINRLAYDSLLVQRLMSAFSGVVIGTWLWSSQRSIVNYKLKL